MFAFSFAHNQKRKKMLPQIFYLARNKLSKLIECANEKLRPIKIYNEYTIANLLTINREGRGAACKFLFILQKIFNPAR